MTLDEEVVITGFKMIVENISSAHRSDDLREIIELQIRNKQLETFAKEKLALLSGYSTEFNEVVVILTNDIDVLLDEQEHGVEL